MGVRFPLPAPASAKASAGLRHPSCIDLLTIDIGYNKMRRLRAEVRLRRTKAGIVSMYYVYLIKSINHPNQHYVGFSDDLKTRIADHN